MLSMGILWMRATTTRLSAWDWRRVGGLTAGADRDQTHAGHRLCVARTLLKQPALSAGHRHLYDYPTPSHLNVLWEFGSLGGIGLHVQIVTGIVLAMHYTPHVVCAAVSIEHILREVYAGHVLRHAHANGASLFFIAV